MKKQASCRVFALITVVLWASAYVFTKVAQKSFSPLSLGALRYVAASLALLAVVLAKGVPLPKGRDVPLFFLAGASGFAVYVTLFNLGSKTLPAATSTVIVAIAPVITALFSALLFKERIRPLGWAAIGVAFLGVLALTLWDGVLAFDTGAVWMLLAAVSLGIYNLVQRRLTKRYSPLQSTAYSVFAGTILLLGFLPKALPELGAASLDSILVVAYLGVFPSAVAYLCWAKGLAIAPRTADVTNFMFVTPLFSTLLGMLVIAEFPGVSTYVGGAVILLGLWLFNRSK